MADLERLAAELAGRVRAAGFAPELIVYVETGARLPACALCREFGVPALAVRARRTGAGLKSLLAPLAALLPRWLKDVLRRAEERSRIHGSGARQVEWAGAPIPGGCRVLLVDDAADTGRTLMAVRAALIERGVAADSIRTAVLAATMPEARQLADFYLFDRICRMPWSADSRERSAARAEMRRQVPPVR